MIPCLDFSANSEAVLAFIQSVADGEFRTA